MKNLLLALLLTAFIYPKLSLAEDKPNCMATFYQTRDMACIDQILYSLPQPSPETPNQAAPINPTALGFFAEIFRIYPDEKARLLAQYITPETSHYFTEALYMAGLQNEIQAYANEHHTEQELAALQKSKPPTLAQIKPVASPAANDILIGAYMASGNTEYISKILDNFSSASEDMAKDALRIAMVQSKFGPQMAPPGREPALIKNACQKYKCKENMNDLARVMTLATAFWALQSLGRQDPQIEKTFTEFFEKNPRLNRFVFIEQNAFSNYVVTLALFSAIKNNPNIYKSLSIYESFGPAEEVTAPLMPKK